uniref:Phosphatidic acid phosphatase type 2/haloperoxidase domain-containing protein n=1 Tax=Timema genevievae TaxID=629358 RepID=A0A7R9JRK8_TIMGE|nr:unnamed protein product [Timema genevievae]
MRCLGILGWFSVEQLEKLKLSLLEQCGLRWPRGLLLIGLELSRDQLSALRAFYSKRVNPQKMGGKRVIPGPLQKLLSADVYLTDKFCYFANNFLPLRSLRVHYKLLEVSCHGIPWLCVWIGLIWWLDRPDLYSMQVNFLIGLLLDIVFVAVIKSLVRRRRPAANRPDMFATIGPDKFSFPSGHASRSVFVAYFFIHLWPLSILTIPPLLAWVTSVCLSRILLRRHHLLDILCGVLLGLFEGVLIGWLWLSQESSTWVVSWLSDEKLEGGSYHV